MPLFIRNFDVVGKIYPIKGKRAHNLQFISRKMIEFLLNNCNLRRGPKINITLPEFIRQDKDLQADFLRGLFDTDGCLKFNKRNGVNCYPRIQISLLSSALALELKTLFLNLGFKFSWWLDDNLRGFNPTGKMLYYRISGKEALHKWFQLVKPANSVHLTKYLLWKKLGYCPIKTTLNQRLELLGKEF